MRTGRSSLVLAFYTFCMALPFLLPAEGTRELRPTQADFGSFQLDQGWGDFGLVGVAKEDRCHIRICQAGEVIYAGFLLATGGPVSYQLRDPNGNIVIPMTALPGNGQAGYINTYAQAVAGPQQVVGAAGYNAIQYTSTMAGDYYIEFQKGGGRETFDLFDITVADAGGNIQTGRLWSQAFQVATGSYTNAFNGKMYIYTTDSVVSEVDFNGILPFSMVVRANGTGPLNSGNVTNDRKSTQGNNSYPFYPVFLNNPDENCFPSSQPDSLSASLSGCGGNYCIDITTTTAGVVSILFDLNGVGGYQPGTKDVMINDSVSSGYNCIPWDGLDGAGNPVQGGNSITVSTTLSTVAIHMPLYDVESHPNGFKIRFIRPFTGTPILFWDDTNINGGGANLGGCAAAAGCHIWNGGQGQGIGENNTINSWWFTPSFVSQFNITIPNFSASVSGTAVSCYGESDGTASATGNGDHPPFTYVWSTGASGALVTGLTAGTYQVTVTDNKGCQLVKTYTVTQPPLITTTTNASSATGCQLDGSATVNAGGGSPGYTYQWGTQPPQTGATATGLGQGTYYVTVTDQMGCTATDSAVVEGVPSSIGASFDYLVDLRCEGLWVSFTNLTQGGTTFHWDFGDGTSSSGEHPVHVFPWGNGSYVVVLTVTNIFGCKDTATLTLTPGNLDNLITLKESNVFTPNEDGFNDCFVPDLGNQNMGACGELWVYNRWGVRIYDSRFGICWNGKTDTGQEAPEGTYYYIFRLDGKVDLHGWVTLMRNTR